MLSFAEEIVLLLLDEAEGTFVPVPESVFGVVVVGAALMDLAIRNRVDADLEQLMVVDGTPLGDDILDDVLRRLGKPAGDLKITQAIYDTIPYVEDYKSRALARLLAHGILREENGRHLWVFRTRRYPVIDNAEQHEVRTRLRQILLTDEIPDPRDIVLICLIDACHLLSFVLSPEEIETAQSRVELLRKMDLIGQAVVKSASEVQAIIRYAASSL
jgi:golgi phosphoprotein 3